MHLAFDIFQGIGIAAAIGIRPFLPSLAAGALAAGDVELHFDHTSYGFLQSLPFLLAMVVCTGLLVALGRALASGGGRPAGRPPAPGLSQLPAQALTLTLNAAALALGALFFAGSLARAGHAAWPGWVAGVICAGVGIAASRPFLARLRERLDAGAAAVGLPLIADGAALLVCVLAVVAPPLGVIALLALLWLLAQGRGQTQRKYAGLRILR